MVSEFGSALNERSELDCFTSITDYFTSNGLANDGRHAPIQSWFYWCVAYCGLAGADHHASRLQCPQLPCQQLDLVGSCLPESLSGFPAHAATALERPCLNQVPWTHPESTEAPLTNNRRRQGSAHAWLQGMEC